MFAPIPIYSAERKLGLANIIQANASIAYASILEIEKPSDKQIAKSSEMLQALATNEGQYDLHYLRTILATIGWNKNDDIFDSLETWQARFTPEDKPLNIEHDPRRIVGHITSNVVIDEDGKIIPDDTSVDELPIKYHVATNAVLYKFLKSKDEKLEQEMKQIIAEINKGEWYVSMECLFANFDYGVIGPDGKTTIIPRNDESAFLTKHLRAYGGEGNYDSYKIGRKLKNIAFSGKGLVRKPANPESIIFQDVANFKATTASIIKEFPQFKTSLGYIISSDKESNKESDDMADSNNDVLQQRLTSAESSLVAANKKNEELQKRLEENNEKQVQAKLDDLNSQVKTKNERIESLDAQVKTEQNARVDAETKLTRANDELKKVNDELISAKFEKTKATRVNQLVERTGVEASLATKTVETLSTLNDESFKSFLETQPAKANKVEQTPEEKAKAEAEAKKKEQVDNTDTKVLDGVTPNKEDAALASSGANKTAQETRAALGKSFRENYLKAGKNKNAAKNKE